MSPPRPRPAMPAPPPRPTPTFRGRGGLLAAVALLAVGCSGPRELEPYERVGAAGRAYAGAMDGLLALSRDRFIDAQSEALLRDRALALDREAYDEANRRAREYARLTGDLRAHARLLGQYFGGLEDLAASDAPAGTRESLAATATAIDTLTASLVGRPALGRAAAPASALGQLVVSDRLRDAVRAEVRERGDVVRRALAAQEALLDALARGLDADAERGAGLVLSRRVTAPFESGAAVAPENQDAWVAARREALLAPLAAAEVRAASGATRDLRRAFEAVAAGGRGGGLAALARSLATFAELVDARAAGD